ncbi:hypothetical protein CKN53_04295 [Acinetobacter baumannii]|uniref:hypothetical protein n=1 Tax=Acinetobacter baumannii TaxID=470 RepID=UPI000C08AA72|nr:hypothetical protein [Acinetobacter baumannii]MBC6785701.1 hypothetical protein [Acinetobacter baumannii]MBC6812791.1 hypothetical protein [Acinetobacter baumannii]MBC6825066.1 hypothetical protein [Acinetobacter baumannii]PHP83904.1 hypothetical protein CKN52_04890 [Acinetobacter baumannii]RLS20308.1 hypothetical protein CKN53_04295 [Acinetobacter baumannii]
MTTLQELSIKRKNQIANRNGTEALRNRIDHLKTLSGEERQRFAEKLKGYIEALFDNQLITFQDAKDWEWIIESNVKGLH